MMQWKKAAQGFYVAVPTCACLASMMKMEREVFIDLWLLNQKIVTFLLLYNTIN